MSVYWGVVDFVCVYAQRVATNIFHYYKFLHVLLF